jgi:hypothetical protein
MAIAGAILLMARYGAIHLRLTENWEEEYQVGERIESVDSAEDEAEEPLTEKEDARIRKLSPEAAKRVAKKTSTRRTSRTP